MKTIAQSTAHRQRVRTAWIEQGYNAHLMALEPSDSDTVEGSFHRYGWDLAESLATAQLEEDKPGLDPMPLPAWDDLMAQHAHMATGRAI